MMATTEIHWMAKKLLGAEDTGLAMEQFGDELDLETAYAVQSQLLHLRSARGEALVGRKLGFTSRAKMEQMGVSELIVGFLTNAMEVPNGGTINLAGLVHPRVEPEVAFRLGASVGPDDDEETWIKAIEAVAPALEVIDSRYNDFKFSLPDVVADNTSACRFVIGEWRTSIQGLDDLAVELTADGSSIAQGSTAAILDGPLNTIPRLRDMAVRLGYHLEAGTIILAGAATAAIAMEPDVLISAEVQGLGTVSVWTTGRNNA